MTILDQRESKLSPQPMRTLLVGDASSAEFRPVEDFLRRETELTLAADMTAACEATEQAGLVPDAVVLVQDRPGVFSRASLDRLRQAAPLARYLGLLGSWCEGEERTGQPWAGMIRTYWHQWLARWIDEFRQGARGDLRWWGLPDTVSGDERTMQMAEQAWPQASGLVAVYGRQADTVDYLVEACVARGYSAIWLDPRRPSRMVRPDVVIWDGAVEQLSELADVVEQFPAAAVIALLDFPRFDDVEQVVALGAAAVVCQPLRLEELFFELARVSGSEGTHSVPVVEQAEA